MISMVFLVSAKLIFVYQDDGLYDIYEAEIALEKGWNLIAFSGEIEKDSEIKERDLKAVYYYNPRKKNYVRLLPESNEFNEIIYTDTCGDASCSGEERENYVSWCYQDCKGDLNDEIISNLNILSEKSYNLEKDKKIILTFEKYPSLEIYWNEDSLSGSCEERGYSGIDCVMLHYIHVEGPKLDNSREFTNSPDDGNPYNDGFDTSEPIDTYANQAKGVIYAKVGYGDKDGEYKFTFYEIDDDRVRVNQGGQRIPSFAAKILSQPAWVYSDKKGLLKMKDLILIKPSEISLQKGWNFVTITPDMTGKQLGEIVGSCNVEKVYGWWQEHQDWDLIALDGGKFNKEIDLSGSGFIIKVTDNCKLGEVEKNITPPPSLP